MSRSPVPVDNPDLRAYITYNYITHAISHPATVELTESRTAAAFDETAIVILLVQVGERIPQAGSMLSNYSDVRANG